MAVDYVPREDAEQAELIAWANAQSGAYPALELLYHVPNEGNRGVIGGVKMAHQGLKKGVPDLCLPVPSGDYHGMYVEMKRRKGAGGWKRSPATAIACVGAAGGRRPQRPSWIISKSGALNTALQKGVAEHSTPERFDQYGRSCIHSKQ